MLLSAGVSGYPGVARAPTGPNVQFAASPVLLGACGGGYPGTVRPDTWDLGCTGVVRYRGTLA